MSDTDARVRPVTVECQRCQAEVPAAELEPGKGVCRDCWEATKEDLRAYEESKERKRRDRRPMTDGGEPAGSGRECMLRGCGNEIPAGRDGGYCSDRCAEASAEMREGLEQTRRAERRAAGEADVLRVAEGGDKEGEGR